MSSRPYSLIKSIILLFILSACSNPTPDNPLPTLAPTAESILPQGNLGRPDTPTATITPELPTQAIPTASPTSPPTPTMITVADIAEDFVSAATIEGRNRTVEAGTPIPPQTETAAPTPTPTHTPTSAPSPTNTPSPIPPPRLPEVIWPSPEPYNLPVSNSPRHGVAVALGGGGGGLYGPGPYSWTYSWTPSVPRVETSIQHVPMLVGTTRANLPSLEQVIELDGYNSHNYWLVFNECEHQHQCNTGPAEAAQFFHDRVVDLLYTQGGDPDADIIVGGVNAHPCGILWLKNFVDRI